ncbi:Mom family adenine methylcarbamoylation protein [Sphingomonas oryzagri]
MLTTRSQRWRERRSRYVDDLEVIDTRRYAVDGISAELARQFVAAHHYLPSFPAAIFCAGLFSSGPGGTSQLSGVAVFAVPSTNAVITRHTGFTNPAAGTTLARFLLLDEIPQNAESWMLARAFRLLRAEKPHIEAVVSYSDPWAGHIGRIYQSLSAAHRGISRPRPIHRIGTVTIAGRTLSKIRLGERGASGAIDQIVALGAPRPMPTETPCGWLERLHRERILLRVQHPGLFTYAFELSRRARALGRALPRKPYPKILIAPHPELSLFD